VKWALTIPDPTSSAEQNHAVSELLTFHVLAAFRGIEVFRSADHLEAIQKVKAEIKICNSVKKEKAMTSIVLGLSSNNKWTILQGKDTGKWLSVLLLKVNGTELLYQEFCDSALLRYAGSLPDLPSQCDGCKTAIRLASVMC
jgi:hypothetical protein